MRLLPLMLLLISCATANPGKEPSTTLERLQSLCIESHGSDLSACNAAATVAAGDLEGALYLSIVEAKSGEEAAFPGWLKDSVYEVYLKHWTTIWEKLNGCHQGFLPGRACELGQADPQEPWKALEGFAEAQLQASWWDRARVIPRCMRQPIGGHPSGWYFYTAAYPIRLAVYDLNWTPEGQLIRQRLHRELSRCGR